MSRQAWRHHVQHLVLPQELVQLIFSARIPGPGTPVLSLADRVRAQAVCTSWKAYLDPRQWPIDSLTILGERHLRLARWVSALRPAVRAFVFHGDCQDALFSLLSVAPRTVLEELTIMAEADLARSFASVVQFFPSLQVLNLEVGGLNIQGLLDCAAFGHLPSLKSLTANGWQRVALGSDVRLPALTFLELGGLETVEVAGCLPSLQIIMIEHVFKVQLAGEGLQLPQLTKLDLECVHDELDVSWAAMPQLGEFYLRAGDDLQMDTSGLAALTRLTSICLAYDEESSGEPVDRVLEAAPPSLCDLCISGSRDDWDLPPPLQQLSHVTSLACCSVDLMPHLRALKQLRKLTLLNASAADLTPEYVGCLPGLTNLQQLHFGEPMPATLASRCRLQVITSVLPGGCEVEQPFSN